MTRTILYELEDGTLTTSQPNWQENYEVWVNLKADPNHILQHKFSKKTALAIHCTLINSAFWIEKPLDEKR